MLYAMPGQAGAKVQCKTRYGNFIGGKWVGPVKGEYFDVVTPISGCKYTQAARSTAEGIALAGQYAAKGSVLAVSDAGCAAVLCKAALQAASLNVFINTKLMADRERAAALDAKTDKLLDEFVSRADAVFASVTNKLRNK